MGRGSRRLIGIAVIATSMVVAATCVRTNRVACDDGTICPEGTTCGTFEGASICVFDTQSCGNGVVDAALGEECDDGAPGTSGDGCSSTCKAERPVWRDVGALISPRISFGVATDPVSGTILFGGAVGSAASDVPLFGSFDETWKWDGGAFERLEPVTRPPRRADFAMAYLGGGPGGGRVVVFGGVGVDGKLLDDTWLWDGYDWEQVSPAIHPAARRGARMACRVDYCVLFGGVPASGSFAVNETWVWRGATWEQAILNPRPGERHRMTMAYDETNGAMVMFGGRGSNAVELTDTWELRMPAPTTATWQWSASTTMTVPANAPAGVTQAVFVPGLGVVLSTVGSVYRYAGGTWIDTGAVARPVGASAAVWDPVRSRAAFLGDTFERVVEQDPSSATFTYINVLPPASDFTSAAFDVERGITVVSDGKTWEWTGTGWRSGPASSTTAQYAPLVYDPRCKRVVRFGGTGSMPHDELWAYNGQWSMLPQGVSRPSVRFRHAMTYDVQRGVIVLVGGTNGVGPLQDTWELSGPCDAPTWQQVATTGPPPRASSAMAFDERRGVSVLFGGSGAGGDLDDTWEWDGIAWTQRAPASASGPEPRSSHALVYDRRRGRVVMFGGSRSNLKLADTWEWRSTDESWGRVPAVVDLPARSGMSFAEDVTGGILAIAGAGPTPSSTSLPTYRLTWQDGPVERCRLPDEDLDGDGLAGCDDPDCRGRCAPTCPIETEFALCPAPSCGDGVLQPVEDPHLCPDDR